MSAFPTLGINPSFPLDPDGQIEDAILRSDFSAGYEQTRPKFTRVRRAFGLRYNLLSDTNVAALRTFEITTLKNGADAFTWTHPVTAVTYTVRLTGPISFSRNTMADATDVSLVMREV